MEGVLSFKIFMFLSSYFPTKSFLCVQCVFYIHCNFYCVCCLLSLRDLQAQQHIWQIVEVFCLN